MQKIKYGITDNVIFKSKLNTAANAIIITSNAVHIKPAKLNHFAGCFWNIVNSKSNWPMNGNRIKG